MNRRDELAPKKYSKIKEKDVFTRVSNRDRNLLERNDNSSLIHVSFFKGLIHHYPGKVEGRIRFLAGGGFARVSNECVLPRFSTKRGQKVEI